MILPIVGYGNPVLRKVAQNINPDYPELKELIANLYQTMSSAYGVGLAAEQVGLPIRLFVIDTAPFSKDESLPAEVRLELKDFKRTFINATMVKEEGDEWYFNEGCLSVPNVREDVCRRERITIEYCEEDFVMKTEVFDGLIARVIQHEYDHLEGIIFTDKISTLKKKIIYRKLKNIIEGKSQQDYKMVFYGKKVK